MTATAIIGHPFRVVRSLSRTYGYALQDRTGRISWVAGPDHTCCWFKLKRDAQHRADVLNAAARRDAS